VIVSETEEAREGPFNSLSETRGKQTPLTLIEAVQPARRFVSNLAKRRLVHALFNNNKKNVIIYNYLNYRRRHHIVALCVRVCVTQLLPY